MNEKSRLAGSTSAGDSDGPPTLSRGDLERHFGEGGKPRGPYLLGIEQEKLAVRGNGDPVPYDGDTGIGALLQRLLGRGYQPVKEGGVVIALERGGEHITLEPGGQVEFSGPALPWAADARHALGSHTAELASAARELDIHFIHGGFRPFGGIEDVPWFPKRRYEVMRAHLPKVGRLGHEMMKRTATIQANLDYSDEADAVDRMRTALGITSIVTAMFASSPISEGRPNGFKCYRAAVWLETDEARCGILPFVFEPGFGFARYVAWALDVPMFFVVREGIYHPVEHLTFRRFMREGWRGSPAVLHDWEIHLSTLFPEVRLKRYIEVRGADAAPPDFAYGLGALWRGLLDDRDARAAAWDLVRAASISEREQLRRDVPRAGLAARLGERPIAEIAVQLCRLADAGLARLPGGDGDRALLAPLAGYAPRGRCPADDMLDDFHRVGGDPARLVQAWAMG